MFGIRGLRGILARLLQFIDSLAIGDEQMLFLLLGGGGVVRHCGIVTQNCVMQIDRVMYVTRLQVVLCMATEKIRSVRT